MARGIQRQAGLLVVCWIATLGSIVFWLTGATNLALRDQLRHAQFWILELQLLLLLIVTWVNVPAFARSLRLGRRDVRLPLASALLAFLLATFLAPPANRIYYDEHIYQGVAHNLTDLRLAQMCNDGDVESGSLRCEIGEYSKEPYGYPYLLSVAYRFTGVHEWVAFAANPIVAAGLVWVVFLVTTALTSRADAGGYAALVMALMPEQLRWAHTASAEPSAALACAFAVLASLSFARLKSTASLIWMVVASAFAVQFRPECVLLVPLVAAVCLAFAPEAFHETRLWWAGLLGLLLSAAHIGHLVAVRGEGWGATGSRLSIAYLSSNLPVNGWFYLGDRRFPVAYTILAMAAVILWRRSREVGLCLLYFLLFWGLWLVFYAGSYNYGSDDRFSLMTFPPLAVLAGIGASCVAEKAGLTLLRPLAGPLMAAALAIQFLVYVPFVRAIGEEAWAARADVAFARHLVDDLPVNSIVLTQNPHMFHLWGRSAAQLSLVSQDRAYAERVLGPRYGGGVFVHWNFWCNVPDPVQHAFCTNALEHFPHALVKEHAERNYRFALYRLDIPPRASSPR